MFASLVFSTFAVEFVRQLFVVVGDLGKQQSSKIHFLQNMEMPEATLGRGDLYVKSKKINNPIKLKLSNDLWTQVAPAN